MTANNTMLLPPQSLQAEQAVLGGLLRDNQAFDLITGKVSAIDFYRKQHQYIFRAIERLAEKQEPFDIITLSEKLKDVGKINEAGGLDYLVSLANDIASAANIGAYANIVRDMAKRREVIHVCTRTAEAAFGKGETRDLLAMAEQSLFAIADRRETATDLAQPIKSLLVKTIDKLEHLHEKGEPITGIATGFHDLDDMTAGLQPADLVIVAGRPSMGKTSLAMNIAEHVSLHNAKPVLIFSMEMPADALTLRLLSSLGKIDANKMRKAQLKDDDWSRLVAATHTLQTAKLLIDEGAALSVAEVRARARRVIREHGAISLIVVDYLQLMTAPDSGVDKVNQITDISRGLKAVAKEFNVPVIALSQLNRNLESRTEKRPMMSDLRDSGAIEQDADLILFVYRDEVYNDNTHDVGVAELIIGKQRNGPLGTVRLTFLNQFTRFENFTGAQHHA